MQTQLIYLLKNLANKLFEKYGQTGDPNGYMFQIADFLAEVSVAEIESQIKKSATWTAKLKNALRHVKIIKN